MLDALREADRFVHAAASTYKRELDEAEREKKAWLGMGGAVGSALAGVNLPGLNPEADDRDTPRAEQELGEALRAVKRTLRSLAAEDPLRGALAARLEALDGDFRDRREDLAQLIRATFDVVRREAPAPSAESPLPDWEKPDDLDAELQRAAGADLLGLLRRTWLMVLLVVAFLAYMFVMGAEQRAQTEVERSPEFFKAKRVRNRSGGGFPLAQQRRRRAAGLC